MGHPSVAHLVCLKETTSGRGRGHQWDLKALGRRDLNFELLRQDPGLRVIHAGRVCTDLLKQRGDGLDWVISWTPQQLPAFRGCKSCVFVYLISTVGM